MFEAIMDLRHRIEPLNKLEVIHGGHGWIAEFEWAPPAGERLENVLHLQKQSFPEDYIQFLKIVANGCLL